MKWFTHEQTGVNKDVMVIGTAEVNNMFVRTGSAPPSQKQFKA